MMKIKTVLYVCFGAYIVVEKSAFVKKKSGEKQLSLNASNLCYQYQFADIEY